MIFSTPQPLQTCVGLCACDGRKKSSRTRAKLQSNGWALMLRHQTERAFSEDYRVGSSNPPRKDDKVDEKSCSSTSSNSCRRERYIHKQRHSICIGADTTHSLSPILCVTRGSIKHSRHKSKWQRRNARNKSRIATAFCFAAETETEPSEEKKKQPSCMSIDPTRLSKSKWLLAVDFSIDYCFFSVRIVRKCRRIWPTVFHSWSQTFDYSELCIYWFLGLPTTNSRFGDRMEKKERTHEIPATSVRCTDKHDDLSPMLGPLEYSHRKSRRSVTTIDCAHLKPSIRSHKLPHIIKCEFRCLFIIPLQNTPFSPVSLPPFRTCPIKLI